MTYKEYVLMRKKYMGTEASNENSFHNNTMINIYPKNEEEKKQTYINKDKEKKNKIRSKSKKDIVKNYYWDVENQDSKVPEESKEYKNTYETNYDENGNEVLNENLFRNRQVEYKTMRKTYTGKFLPNKGKQVKDIKGETMYNFNNNINNNNNGLDFKSKGHRSYYGGFRKSNSKNNFKRKK